MMITPDFLMGGALVFFAAIDFVLAGFFLRKKELETDPKKMNELQMVANIMRVAGIFFILLGFALLSGLVTLDMLSR
jgi:hypothetical protein